MGISFIRTIILYSFVIFAVRIMGKRQIGELQPSEFVVTILISELAAIPMQDLGIPLSNGIIPILTLLACELLLSTIMLKSIKIRDLFSGRPSIIIQNGVIKQKEMKKLRYTIDDLMEELRIAGYTTIEEVDTAIMETNGKLSVFPKGKYSPLTPESMSLPGKDKCIPIPLIVDGRLIESNFTLAKLGIDEIKSSIKSNNLNTIKDVFFMYCDNNKKITLIRKDDLS